MSIWNSAWSNYPNRKVKRVEELQQVNWMCVRNRRRRCERIYTNINDRGEIPALGGGDIRQNRHIL